MKEVSTFVSDRLASGSTTYYVLFKLERPGGALRQTSLPYNVTVDSEVYLTGFKAIDFSRPTTNNAVDRSEYVIQFSDLARDFEESLTQVSATAAVMTLSLGFFDPATGAPDLTHAMIVYRGGVDGIDFKDSGSERLLLLKAVSPMGALDFTNLLMTSADSIKRFDTGDTSMDFIGEQDEAGVKLGWGKKSTT